MTKLNQSKLENAIKALKRAEKLLSEVQISDQKFKYYSNIHAVNYQLNWVISAVQSDAKQFINEKI